MTDAARKVPNPDQSGACDNCGKDLGLVRWRMGESTGCTRRCVTEDYMRDLMEHDDGGGES